MSKGLRNTSLLIFYNRCNRRPIFEQHFHKHISHTSNTPDHSFISHYFKERYLNLHSFFCHRPEIILQTELTAFLPFIHPSKVFFAPSWARQPWACVITLTSLSGLSFNSPSRLIGCGQPLAQGSCLIRYVLCCTCPHFFCPPPVFNGQQRVSFMCTHPCKSTSPKVFFFFLLQRNS